MLDVLEPIRRGEDLIDGLLLLTVLQANVSQISADRDLQMLYSAADEVPPDELRRPISVSAVAQSTRLPFETVRRRLANLAARERCRLTDKGYVVPTAVVLDPWFADGPRRLHDAALTLFNQLQPTGALDGLVIEPAIITRGVDRLVSRQVADYVLRLLALLVDRTGDPIDGLILLCLLSCNLAEVEITPSRTWARDEMFTATRPATPAKAVHLSARLHLPNETLRRRIAVLAAKGLCRRVNQGWEMTNAAPTTWPSKTPPNRIWPTCIACSPTSAGWA